MTINVFKIGQTSFGSWITIDEFAVSVLQQGDIVTYPVKVGTCDGVGKINLESIPYWDKRPVFHEVQKLYNGNLVEPIDIHYTVEEMLNLMQAAGVKMGEITATTHNNNPVPVDFLKSDLNISSPFLVSVIVGGQSFAFPDENTTRADQFDWIHKIIIFANGVSS